jgi:hypothetical protein
MSGQIQCAECYCTLYFTGTPYGGVTGELCSTCQKKKDDNDKYDDDDD